MERKSRFLTESVAGSQGADSDVFVREAMRLMKEHGYSLGNLDATIIAEVCTACLPSSIPRLIQVSPA